MLILVHTWLGEVDMIDYFHFLWAEMEIIQFIHFYQLFFKHLDGAWDMF